MAGALQRAWLRRGPLAALLFPVSLVFGALAALRRQAYRTGLLASEHPGVPVVVVGNVVAGGSGKTPVVQAIVHHLHAQGLRVGVVSRGYGRATHDCREVRRNSDVRDVGDEPLLIARSCNVPVFVATRRIAAARALRTAYPQTQVIVCDDGLQHLALARDIELCVFDARGVGNGWLLPAGPLREPWPRPVDFTLVAGDAPGIAGHRIERRLAAQALRPDGSTIDLHDLQGRPLTALAGIANPGVFFDMLREEGLTLARTLPLPDHHDFGRSPPLGDGPLLCTEKDAVKLWRVRPDALAVPLQLHVGESFWREFDARLAAKLSSTDGPQTA